MDLKILYEDATLLVVDKPAGIDIEEIQELLPKGFALAHRLDKDTSGVLLAAKTKDALGYLQKQFQERKLKKSYLCLVEGIVKKDKGTIETLLGRSPADRRKQKAFPLADANMPGKREAVTEYKVQQRYQGYTLLEAFPKTGRKHQIRAHLASLSHPVAGDKLYGFKNQKNPEGLTRQFLHANSLTLHMPDQTTKTFTSELPQELHRIVENLKEYDEQA
jgi:23S rRNA pseudouridine1911/1915/1917 synthase